MTENREDQTPAPTPAIAPLKPAGHRSVAVAIKGEDGRPDSLPKVIASGRGKLAEQILELAFAKGVKVREDADLAELLAKLDLDTPIPPEAIIAVAEILARVYEANASHECAA
jgi:flagellar biosynthesis protein